MAIETLRELLSVALIHRNLVSPQQFYAVEQRSDGSPLERDQCVLIRHLLGLRGSDGSRQKEPTMIREMERGLILACLGQDDVLRECARFCLSAGEMHTAYAAEEDYDATYSSSLTSLILFFYGKVTTSYPLSPYLEAIKAYLSPRLVLKSHAQHPVQGVATYETTTFRLFLTCLGVASGFGAFYKEKEKILTFGPCFFPLGISDHFGIFRTRDEFQDVFTQEVPFHFSGWARAAYQGRPTDLWTFIDASATEQGCEIKVKFNTCSDFIPFAFVFFIEAEKALVNGKHCLHPGTLDRYHEGAAPVVFGENGLVIKPLFQSEMQLIPLSGASHYWGATFLLAFVIADEAKTYSFEIK